MALQDEKFITLTDTVELIKHLERNIPVYTMAEYKEKKSEIPYSTYFCISDDSVQASEMEAQQVTSDDIDSLIDSDDTTDDGSLDDLFTS